MVLRYRFSLPHFGQICGICLKSPAPKQLLLN
nr:MAG TPA: hypothetical protein [Caudoviricetes sp.]DAS63970.1 MAG TPA: hypothetical protein [Caudoviricetes sp.]